MPAQCKVLAIDIAKNVFQIAAFDSNDRLLFNHSYRREKFKAFMAKQPAMQIVMEACYSSHYWGGRFEAAGHTVRLIPAQYVKPFVIGNKSDKNDAQAIFHASQREQVRAVPVKTREQLDIQCVHRMRSQQVKSRTALSNQVRGLLSNYGLTRPTGAAGFKQLLADACDPASGLSPLLREQLHLQRDMYVMLTKHIDQLNRTIAKISRADMRCQQLMSIPGIGCLNATAIVSAVNRGERFANAREFAVWLGLAPRSASSGDRHQRLGISKRGDRYLRTQLVHGARSVARCCRTRDSRLHRWVRELIDRRGMHRAVVALAAKLARLCWTLLNTQRMYQADYDQASKASVSVPT